MTTCHLRPAVHLALRGRDAVFLDTRHGAYHCLAEVAPLLSATPGRRMIEVHDRDLMSALEIAELVAPSPYEEAPRQPPPPLPGRDLACRGPLGRPGDLTGVVLTLLTSAADYHGRGFRHLLASIRREPADVERLSAMAPSANLEAEVLGFQAWLPWAPFQGLCLYRSFMLLRHLRRRGHDALWLFGVRTWPFEAHCWLQVGDMVLDDSADRISAYTPILVA